MFSDVINDLNLKKRSSSNLLYDVLYEIENKTEQIQEEHECRLYIKEQSI